MVPFNRSVPVNTVLPHLVYPDLVAASSWLSATFGFTEHYRYGDPSGPVQGVQMHLGQAWIMLALPRSGSSSTPQPPDARPALTVFVSDVDVHFQRTKSAGAKIVEDLNVTVYGERQYGVEDLAGRRWLFAQHSRDLSPDEWGATISEPVKRPTQISPMLAVSDGRAAITFYESAFGATVLWHLEGGGGHVVAGLSIEGAPFFLAHESPEYGTRGPSAAGFTTVRLELFVSDPIALHARALTAGAVERSPVVEHTYSMAGPHAIKRMLQGSVHDPFGHMWLIGKILEEGQPP